MGDLADAVQQLAVAQPDGSQIAPFEYGFVPEPEGKAVVTEVEDGDLIIEGWAADFDGVDRQNENFMDGAFERGLKAYMNNPVLCYHHDRSMALGQVLEATPVEGKGLWIKARIDKPEPRTIAADIYNKVKKGTIKALSIGGFFKRKLTPQGWRINDVDFTEISVTPVPVKPTTTFAVVAGKAFDNVRVPDGVTLPGDDIDPAALDAAERALTGLDVTLTHVGERYTR